MPNVITLFTTSYMLWIVILIVIDVVLGILAALVRKEFAFGKLCNFMKGPVLGYIFGFAIIEVVGFALSLAFIVPVVFVLIVISLLVSIFGNLGKMGLPLPEALKK